MDIPSYLLGKKAGGGTPTVLEEKDVTVTSNGESTINPSEGYNGISKVNLTTNVQPNLESKSVTISTNTTTTIQPTQGKDGLSSVEVTTNVPSGVNLLDYFNEIDGTVTSSNQNPGYVHALKKMGDTITALPNDCSYYFSGCPFPTIELSHLNTSNVTNMANMFQGIKAETIDLSTFNTSNVTNMYSLFYFSKNLTSVDLSTFNTSNVTNMSALVSRCDNLTSVNLSNFDTSKVKNMNGMFQDDVNLTSLDLSSFTTDAIIKGTYYWQTSQMFSGCTNLQHLDIRAMVLSRFGSSLPVDMMRDVPTTCEIIVKNATEKNWWNTKYSAYTNVKTVEEYEGS